MKTKELITYKQYRDSSSELHEAYYGQFVNDSVKKVVLSHFNAKTLSEAFKQDKNLNNLDIKIWDKMYPAYSVTRLIEVGECVKNPPISTHVCIMKAAAIQIIKEYENESK